MTTKLSGLKSRTFIISHSFCGLGVQGRGCWAGWFRRGCLLRLHPRSWLGSEGVTGAGGPASQVAHSEDWQVGAGCREVSVPCPKDLSTRLLDCLRAQQLLPPKRVIQACKVGAPTAPAMEGTLDCLCTVLLVTEVSPARYGRGIAGPVYQES